MNKYSIIHSDSRDIKELNTKLEQNTNEISISNNRNQNDKIEKKPSENLNIVAKKS